MIFTPDSSVLVIFCKRPKVGVGKQRVATELGAHAALALSELLLNAALADAAEWAGPVVIAPAGAADADWAAQLLPDALVVAQQGRNLGERINHVDGVLRQMGAEHVLIMGTDAPGLNARALAEAARALGKTDTVFVPAQDGGVTLLGARRPWPELSALPWETGRLSAALSDGCDAAGLSATWLTPSETVGTKIDRDVDHYADLLALTSYLKCDPRPTRKALLAWAESQPVISVVIPVRRDSVALRALLNQLGSELTDRDELIVVDAEQMAECKQVCDYFGARYLSVADTRGARMNIGARASTGSVLWFVHADATVSIDVADSIRRQVLAGARGGYFAFRFKGERTWIKTILEAAINLRTLFGTPYGDQALFFTRAAFEDAGGFADSSLFEEVALIERIRRGGGFLRMTEKVEVSPRRWEQDGWLARTLQNRLLAIGFALGIPARWLAQKYRGAHQGPTSTTSLANDKQV